MTTHTVNNLKYLVAATTPNNLPLQLTSFIGRKREIAEIKHLVEANRLVTVTGVGGAGKTRLALISAANSLTKFSDGIFFVEFAALTDPNLVPQAVFAALKLVQLQNNSSLDTLIDYLQTKNLLLILDNCEHLINACAQLANTLLLACPQLHILVTSRETLNIDSEIIWRIPSLSLPPASIFAKKRATTLPEVEKLYRYEAVQLFVERAKNAQPDFQLSLQNIEAVSRICRQLDGIPLAIELAAAALKAMSVNEIVVRLAESFRLLTGGSRVALKRQQTLEATIDWSYKLLEEPERALFRRLSIFAGGFTIEDAELVCSYSPLQQSEILTHLTQLVYKSILLRENGRYRMLEMLRQFGHLRLVELAELGTLQKHYAEWCLHLAEEAVVQLDGPKQNFWFNRLIAEQDNLRAVLLWCFENENQANHEIGVGICVKLAKFWRGKAFGEEGRRWLEKAVELTKVESYRASLLSNLGSIAIFSGEPAKALELHRTSIMLWRKLADKSGLATALMLFGNTLVLQGEAAEGETILQEAIELHRQLNNKPGLAHSLCSLGMNYHLRDRLKFEPDQVLTNHNFNLPLHYRLSKNQDKAREILEEALSISRQTEDEPIIGFVLQILGEVARAQGDYNRAKTCYEECLVYNRMNGNYLRLAPSLVNQGYVAIFFQEHAQAGAYLNEGLTICKEHRLLRSAPVYFSAVSELARVCSQPERATRLLAAAQAAHHNRNSIPDVTDMIEYYRTLQRLQTEVPLEVFTKTWAEGLLLSIDQALDYALQTLQNLELKPVKATKAVPVVNAPASLPAGLSLREVEVLRLLAAGLTNVEIAERLVISPRTVDAHLTSIYGKIGVKSRSAATRYAIEAKLV